ncbi:MAG: HAD family hydrolase [Vicinamibacterales bacterium]
MAITTVLFDIDGTLVDSNDAHAQAWVQAFGEAGRHVDPQAVRRAIGMGGDKLLPAVSGLSAESAEGKRIASRRAEIFESEHLPALHPLPDAYRLVSTLKERGFALAAASSAKKDELQQLLDIAGVTALLDAATSSDDADESKPDPDIVMAALRRLRAQADQALLIGDTPYDVAAAGRARVPCIAFRCGGWSDRELAGAVRVYDDPRDLLARLNDSPLGRGAE